jgi:hypothetical protein
LIFQCSLCHIPDFCLMPCPTSNRTSKEVRHTKDCWITALQAKQFI